MELIILLIIIFFVWRHFKKKKARGNENRKTTSSKATSGSASTVSRSEKASETTKSISDTNSKFEGFPIYAPNPVAIGPRRGTAVSENSLPVKDEPLLDGSEDTNNPDYAFACAKAYYEKYLEKYKKGKFDIDSSTGRTVSLWVKTGNRLARYYETGYGCDQDLQAALELLLQLDEYMIVQCNKETNRKESEEEAMAFCSGAETLLALGECYACLGKTKESEKYYRMALASSQMFKYPEIFEKKVLNSALGGYPVPANPTLAGELALKLVQQNKVFAAYTMLEIKGLQNMDYQKIGQSCEQDFQIYLSAGRKTGSAYAAYKLGACYLYGIGTKQNVEQGLSLLHDASFCDNLNATEMISAYLDGVNLTYYKDENGKKLSSAAYSKASDVQSLWEDRVWNMEDNTKILSMIQNVIDHHAGAEDIIGKRINPAVIPAFDGDLEDEFDNLDRLDSKEISGPAENEFDISRIPVIVYDDSNRQWKRRGIFGDHAVYYNNDGDEVTIYSAQVSGSSASTSAGTLHWY